MKSSARIVFAACLVIGAATSARAAEPAAPARPAAGATALVVAPDDAETTRGAGEPFVQRTVIEDGRARIEELRVRGQLQRITVVPKGRAPGYEVLTSDGSREFTEDPGTSRGSAGKRVWNVLRF